MPFDRVLLKIVCGMSTNPLLESNCDHVYGWMFFFTIFLSLFSIPWSNKTDVDLKSGIECSAIVGVLAGHTDGRSSVVT
jgi:hypothetical protein